MGVECKIHMIGYFCVEKLVKYYLRYFYALMIHKGGSVWTEKELTII